MYIFNSIHQSPSNSSGIVDTHTYLHGVGDYAAELTNLLTVGSLSEINKLAVAQVPIRMLAHSGLIQP